MWDWGTSGVITNDTKTFGLKKLKMTIDDDVLLQTGAA